MKWLGRDWVTCLGESIGKPQSRHWTVDHGNAIQTGLAVDAIIIFSSRLAP
jgi:hypothetical protein